MANNNRAGEIEEEDSTPLLHKTYGSDPIQPRARTVTTKVPEAEVHVYKQGKGPIDVIKTGLTGWDQDQLEVREILDNYGFKSIYAFTPGSGRGVPIRFNPRNGRSMLAYKGGAVIYVDGEPKESMLNPITKILLGVALITIMIVLVHKETPEWARKFNISGGRIPPWVLACAVILFTRMRKRTKNFLERSWRITDKFLLSLSRRIWVLSNHNVRLNLTLGSATALNTLLQITITKIMQLKHPRHAVATLLAVLVFAAVGRSDAVLCDKFDMAALLAVKSELGNPPALSGWNSTVACCSWEGISCNGTTGRVTELTILALNISAPVPAAIANLTALQTVNFAYNQLYGSIPAFLGPHALPDLTFLRLDGNRLTGAIPPTITVFDLSLVGNRLTGSLPASFGSASFGDVDLTDNQLTGDASMLFGTKKQLNALHLSHNLFEFNLSRVQLPEVMDILEIDHNMVYGSIPAAAAGMKWLMFDVSYNQLCGPIPQGRYTHRFGAKHFTGNKCLCDPPLPPCKS